ncbi:unnamed protein product [Agarophyton chilense]
MAASLRAAARFTLRSAAASAAPAAPAVRALKCFPTANASAGAGATPPYARCNAAREAFGISCIRLPDLFALSNSPPMGAALSLFEALKPRAVGVVRRVRLASVGDALVVLRGAARSSVGRRVGTIRAVPGRYVRAAVGMAWAAAVASEPRHTLSASLFRESASDQGPRRIGIGCLSPFWRKMLARLVATLLGGGAVYVAICCPQGVGAVILAALLCFATRPDLKSFVTWIRERAPAVANGKQLFVDRVKVLAAPYLLSLRPPVLQDYGLFSLVTLTDRADYVYVYAGCMSRWCLLGWYNCADEYDFDAVQANSF